MILAGAVLGVVVSVGLPGPGGCGALPEQLTPEAEASRQEVVSANGLLSNGLLSNGLLSNGLLSNGLLSNGLLSNGLLSNGLLSNGLLSNGLLSNGLLSNGLLSNGLLSNGLLSNGLLSNGIYDNGLLSNGLMGLLFPNPLLPAGSGADRNGDGQVDSRLDAGEVIDNSQEKQSAAQLNRMFLRYLYECAKPSSYRFWIDLNGNGKEDVLRPDGGIVPGAVMGMGPEGREVQIPDGGVFPDAGEVADDNETFLGALGLAAEAGTDDAGESTERWISACLFARVNLWGKKVEISMRAPPIPTTADELADYTVREGTYFGNLFRKTNLFSSTQTCTTTCKTIQMPGGGSFVDCSYKTCSTTYSSTSAGIAFACWGEGSDDPQLTGRFCSSQYNTECPIRVQTHCAYVCTPRDAGVDPSSCVWSGGPPDFNTSAGAAQDYYPSDWTVSTFSSTTTTPATFDEVITVYLKPPPSSMCGNGVCESGETASACADCVPGWSQQYGTNAYKVIADSSGNHYVLSEGLISKYTSAGAGGAWKAVPPRTTAMAIDSSGNVYIAGTFSGGVDLTGSGTDTYTSAKYVSCSTCSPGSEADDIFAARYSPSGVYQWGKQLGGGSIDVAHDIVLDSLGGLVVAGTFDGYLSINYDSWTTGTPSAFLWRLDAATGALKSDGYGQPFNYSPTTSLMRLAADPSGSTYLTATTTDVTSYGPEKGLLLGKYSSSLTRAWNTISVRYASAEAIGVDSSGDVYVAGNVWSELTNFNLASGAPELGINSRDGAFLAKYSSAGQVVWLRRLLTNGRAGGMAMAFDASGNVLLGGSFWKSGHFGKLDANKKPVALQALGWSDAFLATFTSSGGYLNARRFGLQDNEGVNGLAVDSLGNVVLAGPFHQKTSLGLAGTLTAASTDTWGAYSLLLTKCTPTTCAAEGKNCGTITDGCGNELDCGGCSGTDTCGGGGLANICGTCNPGSVCRASKGGCDPAEQQKSDCTCPADTLTAKGTECRPATSGCDVAESCAGTSASCPTDGFASGGTACTTSGGYSGACEGTSASCVCTTESNADFCSRQGASCGSLTGTDNCGASRTVSNCGTCASGYQCSGTQCVATAFCGSGAVDPGEHCDDGNAVSGDGCSSACTFEPGGGAWASIANGTQSVNIAWHYAMGYHLTPLVDGVITDLGGLFNGAKTVRLFEKATGALLREATVTSANSWSYAPVTPVAVRAGTTYTVAVYLANSGASYRYSITPLPRTNRGLRIDASTYIYTAVNPSAIPTNSIYSTMYGQADVIFVPSSPTVRTFDALGETNSTFTNFGGCAAAVLSGGPWGSYARITPACGGSLNTLAFDRTKTGPSARIVADFDFRITGGNRADGLGIVLLNTANHGATGAGPVIYEEPNLAGTIGVGFDIYNNWTSYDTNNNHVSLHWNGALVTRNDNPGFDLVSTAFHHAQVTVDFSGGDALVSVVVRPNGGAAVTVLSATIPGVQPYESRLAFGARTGGLYANHDVDNVVVSYLPLHATTQTFDAPGTKYAATSTTSCSGAVLAGGPTGQFLRLAGMCGGAAAVGFDRTRADAPSRILTEFDFRITPGSPRADGMSVALLDTNLNGTTGAPPFIAEEPNVAGAIGVGFDIFYNGVNGDPNNNHISLHWNGTRVALNASPGFDLGNAKFNRAKLKVEFTGGNAVVTLTVTPAGGTPLTIFNGVVIPGVQPYPARAAFGARIGLYKADHDIDNVSVLY
ncbi:MAG: DUF4082 domain-containing protein [Myxococcales bacterium]|nr:DUF4082 domain-containing protein [Myxococcales bacterium]